MMNSTTGYQQNFQNSQNSPIGGYQLNMMPSNQNIRDQNNMNQLNSLMNNSRSAQTSSPQATSVLGRYGTNISGVPLNQPPGLSISSSNVLRPNNPNSGMGNIRTFNSGNINTNGLNMNGNNTPIGPPPGIGMQSMGLSSSQRTIAQPNRSQNNMINSNSSVNNVLGLSNNSVRNLNSIPSNYQNEIMPMVGQSKGPLNYMQTMPLPSDRIQSANVQTSKGLPNFDSTDFPSIRSSGPIPNNMGQINKQSEQNQEFNFGMDDFPALPGYKNSDQTSIEDHQYLFRGQSNLSMPYAAKANQNVMSGQMNAFPMGLQDATLQRQQSGTYEQYLPHLHRQQQQKKNFMPDRFGLLGLLSVIRMTDPDLNTLALGTDLTTLGLNLNSPECLYNTFSSPWAEGPSKREPEYYIPMCYYMQSPLQSPLLKITLFSEETLFYIFYSMPRDLLQAVASNELYKREWRYHKELKLWITRVPNTDSQKTTTHERGSFIYFDPGSWEKVRKDNVLLAYDQIEPPLSINP
jgi:CCR4-NOT transcription complex subunit 2